MKTAGLIFIRKRFKYLLREFFISKLSILSFFFPFYKDQQLLNFLFASQDPEKDTFVVQQTEMITLMPFLFFLIWYLYTKSCSGDLFELQGDAALKGPT